MSRIKELCDPFYVQCTSVFNDYVGRPRLEVFALLCAQKKVLHIGCTGHPRTNVANNLHIQLSPHCATIDGFDIFQDAYPILQPHVHNGDLLSCLKDANSRQYDVILIPEVLEHVGDQRQFLSEIGAVQAEQIILTVPDLFQCFKEGRFEYYPDSGDFLEAVHPDHNCWYSPYTIANTINKYTDWAIEGIYWLENISLLVSCRSHQT
jgi:hypothetical protein